MQGPPVMMNYILLVRPFSVSSVAIPTQPQSITLHLLIPLEAPLIQSQGTQMRSVHIPFMDLIMNQIGIYNIPLIPHIQHLNIYVNIPS